ncbi:DUF1284 domain-containing protein [Clostridium akagii]|uniref:DUF1284 domain-containing protein n=1 Tax=Clostridium akagii TaxID=91623 RepID=UPI00047E0F5F|nr:DUF1284 domain-containing protein [Clostridium akagii]
MYNEILNIRAHHLLCIQGFQGYGYSGEFVENMGKIVKYIKENPKEKIRIVEYCDNICLSCKNNISDMCKNCESVDNMDKRLLDKLKLTSEQVVNIEEAFNLVNDKLKSLQDAYEICGECSWSEKCLWISKFH